MGETVLRVINIFGEEGGAGSLGEFLCGSCESYRTNGESLLEGNMDNFFNSQPRTFHNLFRNRFGRLFGNCFLFLGGFSFGSLGLGTCSSSTALGNFIFCEKLETILP